jgi:hypothetical protein
VNTEAPDCHLVAVLWSLAENGDDHARRFAFIVVTLRKLKDENRLTAEQAEWLSQAEEILANLR